MNGLMNILVAVAATLAPGDPPTFTVVGDTVTINGDFIEAYSVPSTVPITLVSGVPIMSLDNRLLASSDGVAPIVFRMPPGSYTINAFGYPVNRLQPQRATATFTVVVANATRMEQIKAALIRFSTSTYDVELAKSELKTLKPTASELKTVFTTP